MSFSKEQPFAKIAIETLYFLSFLSSLFKTEARTKDPKT